MVFKSKLLGIGIEIKIGTPTFFKGKMLTMTAWCYGGGYRRFKSKINKLKKNRQKQD